MQQSEFQFLADFLKSSSGLSVSPEKQYLVDSRLLPVAQKAGLSDLSALVTKVRQEPRGKLAMAVAEAMTTNETLFFRDRRPFDTLRKHTLPALIEARKKSLANGRRIRIWSAATSTGQEAYSIAMILKDMKRELTGLDVEIHATDYSAEVVEKAKRGVYSQFEVQRGLPIKQLMTHFSEVEGGWAINDDLKSMIRFGTFNLLDSMISLGKFDIIFCRNVLIYFDNPTKASILDRMQKILTPEGSLFLGGAETVVGVTESFRPDVENRGVYLPVERQVA